MKYKIALYIPGMACDGNTIKAGKSLGGSETAGLAIAKELKALGHKVLCFTNTEKPDFIDGIHYIPIGEQTKAEPLGVNYSRFAISNDFDIMIAQRHPLFYSHPIRSKVNFWWSHDLALKRSMPQINRQLVNIDNVMCVSKFHKKQIQGVYNIKDSYINVIENGIEKDLYNYSIDTDVKFNSKVLLFSSRPERGLENLLKDNGVMDHLWKIDKDFKLIVTGYDNTTDNMRGYYEGLWARCQHMPNADFWGAKSKAEMALLEKNAFAYVYPSTFEETSCITAMNSQASGTPFLSYGSGALKETLKDGGAIYCKDPEEMANELIKLSKSKQKYEVLSAKAKHKSKQYSWTDQATKLINIADDILRKKASNQDRLARHFYKMSDIQRAKEIEPGMPGIEQYDRLFTGYKEYYDEAGANLFEATKKVQADYKNHDNDLRVKSVTNELEKAKPGTKFLDYGCALGQQTLYYASKFPDLHFTGVDISKQNVEQANKFAKEKEISNVNFIVAKNPSELLLTGSKYGGVVCTEVLEHIVDYYQFINDLEEVMEDDAQMIFTTPGGISDEFIEHKELGELPQHINFFEYDDLMEMFEEKKNFFFNSFCYGFTDEGYQRSSNFFTYLKSDETTGQIDEFRKHRLQSPAETLSVCMIAKENAPSIRSTLLSISQIADEIIIGVDGYEENGLIDFIAKDFNATVFPIESPLKQGFDAARNITVEKARFDWILWIDSDEILQYPLRLKRYLRNNQFDGYGVAQHHFSGEPPERIKTDLPVRLFRNNGKIKFWGLVHEHPETEINKGPGNTFVIPQSETAICHHGYETEAVRRKRFVRNWPLMQEDRKKYPERKLAQFLWIRDLIHVVRFEREKNKGKITPNSMGIAQEVVKEWRKLVENKELRFASDSLPYYSEAVDVLTNGQGISYAVSMQINTLGYGDNLNEPANSVKSKFLAYDDIRKFSDLIREEKIGALQSDYI